MHVVRRAQQWRQRQDQNEDRGGGKALYRGGRHDPGAGTEHDADGRDHAEQPANDIRPRLALEPSGDREQQERRRQLADI